MLKVSPLGGANVGVFFFLVFYPQNFISVERARWQQLISLDRLPSAGELVNSN
ncbi:hypothetical protein EXN66_Car015198 [Channa argus]|uniref:Uncharacterized protein n=1 Tax=Channa argus TaxID=215402 RepID=A0A6G1QA45_CHAAH|nr:hypothetical protein EXN66_Car015198 [Channa argus]